MAEYLVAEGWNDSGTLLAILEGMGEGVIVFDLTGRPLYLNSAVARLHGMPRPFEVTRNLLEYDELFNLYDALGEPIPRDAWPVERVLRGERFFNWEVYAQPHGLSNSVNDGTGEGGVVAYSGFQTDGKSPVGVLLLHDVYEQRRTEETLRRSEERELSILDNLRDYAIFTLSLDGVITSWNPGVGKVLGYAEEEFVGRSGNLFFTPEEREAGTFEWEMTTSAREGRASDDRWQLHKSGRRLWINGIMSALRTSTGELRGYVKIMRDYTERLSLEQEREGLVGELQALNETLEARVEERTQALKEANERLRRSEERFAKAFQLAPVAAAITTLDGGRLVDANQTALEWSGYTLEEAVNRPLRELELLGASEVERLASRLGAEGRFINQEVALHTASQGLRHALLSSEVVDIAGERCVLSMAVDITERKRTEEQLLQALQEVMQDTAWFSQSVMEKLAQIRSQRQDETEVAELTPREKQVLAHLARGESNEDIAGALELAPQTVRNYITTIYSKINAHSRAEAVVWARERGLGV